MKEGEPLMSDNKTKYETLSPAASKARNEYYKAWRGEHPERVKAIQLRYWETKAQKIYGAAYQAPSSNESMSEQAKEVRKKYYADHRAKNAEKVRRSAMNFWEKRSKEQSV